MELIRPFAVPPWWQPPATRIAPDKDTAIKEHDLILRATPLYGPSSANAYTNGSRTERESVGASAVTSKGNATARLNSQDTVHAAEIKGILLALSQIKDDLVRELAATSRAPACTTTIFTDNQAAIQACTHPRRSSGQHILRNIAIQIETLRLAAWSIRIHWIPKSSNFVDPETQKRCIWILSLGLAKNYYHSQQPRRRRSVSGSKK